MTTRTAELLMAILMGLLSIGLMVKSAELEIGWIPDRGPGGGAWPFWLSALMLLCCIITIYRWWRKSTPESRSMKEFMDKNTRRINYITVGSLVVYWLFSVLAAGPHEERKLLASLERQGIELVDVPPELLENLS